MPQYAYFDSTATPPAPVLGWFDTDRFNYPNLPDQSNLLELTTDQWNARQTGLWAVSSGTLVSYTPPMSLPQQAQIALAAALAQGIAVTSVTLPVVNGTYALDGYSTGQIFQIGLFAAQFGFFPSGASEQPYPDLTSQIHMFTVPIFISFLHAVAPLIANLQAQAGIMAQGGTPTWPVQTAALG